MFVNIQMSNFEIIETIEKIVSPYFEFNVNDIYGDRIELSCKIPKIEEMSALFFKFNGRDRKLKLTNEKQKEMIDKINNLKVGYVTVDTFPSFGKYIIIELISE